MAKHIVRRRKSAKERKNGISSASSTNPNRVIDASKKASKLKGFYRNKSTINRLNMYSTKVDDKKRKIPLLKPVRVEPNRKWFGNTRVVTQNKLDVFRTQLKETLNDPYNIVLKKSKLPMSLLKEPTKENRMHLLSIESFDKTFGKNKQRKRPKIAASDLEEIVTQVQSSHEKYEDTHDKTMAVATDDGMKHSEEIFKKGTSKRIWAELYKVVDSSDVIVQVIDARDPMGTRCKHFEAQLKKDRPHKHLVLLMNKSDLIPVWAVERWVKVLSSEYPTLAFHASINHPFGKHPLIQLLRQYAGLIKDRKHLSVGFIGYPNVGKSSVINALRKSKVCKAAPTPGETRVWQYVALTTRIYLIDCPGVVPNDADSKDDTSKILKGAIRAERVTDPESHIHEVLSRVKRDYLIKRYVLPEDSVFDSAESFLTLVATKMGKLLKGGEPDISTAARIVLYDWQRGRLPFFTVPPFGGLKNAVDSGMQQSTIGSRDAPPSLEATATTSSENTAVAVGQTFKTLVCDADFDYGDLQEPSTAVKESMFT